MWSQPTRRLLNQFVFGPMGYERWIWVGFGFAGRLALTLGPISEEYRIRL